MITKSGGAAYSPDLNNEVTHLVVGPVFTTRDELIENGKYKYAKQINAKRAKRQEAKRPIYIVWGEWLEHCLYAFGRVKEEFYSTDVFPDRHEVKPAPGQRSQDIIERRNIASPKKVRRQRSQGDQAQIKSKRKLIKQESVASMNGSERTSRKRSGTSEGVESLAVLKKGKTEPEGNDIDMEGRDSKASFLQEKESKEDLEPAAVRKQSSALSLHPLDGPTNAPAATSRAPMKKQRSSTHMELLGVQDLLVPKANSSSYSLQSAATSTTATLAPQPESSIMANPTPSGTNNSLLSRMGKERSNKFFSKGRESTPVQTKPDASTSKTTLEACKAESVEVLSRSASPLPVPQMPDEEVQVAADHGHNVPAPSRLFEGKRFHVVEDDFDKSLRSRITDLMIERGAIPSATINDKTDLVICKTIS